jgi:hypothetical protein
VPGQRWEQWEIDRLKALLAQGFAASEMTIGTRTTAAIQNQATRLNLIGDGVSRRPWPSRDEEKLRQLLRQGCRPSDILRDNLLPGYGRDAIGHKISRLGLGNSDHAQRIRAAGRLTERQRLALHDFLGQYWMRCTPEQIAQLWNRSFEPKVTRQKVVYHLKQLGLKLPWRKIMQMPYSRAKRRHRSAEQVSSQQRRWRRYRRELRAHLEQLAKSVSRRAPGKRRIEQHTCHACKTTWPAAEPFFLASKKRTRSGVRTNFSRICRLCFNSKRRRARLVNKAHA